MKAIILAAGIGSRLSPITLDKPKSMIIVAGKSLLEQQICAYLKANILESNIYIAVGYMSDKIKEFIFSKYPKINIVNNSNFLETNNMYSLYLVFKKIGINNICNDILISNADCIYNPEIIVNLVNNNQSNLIACQTGFYNEESMKIKINDGGDIIDISKELERKDSFGVSIDLYRYNKQAILLLFGIIEDIIINQKKENHWTEYAFPKLFSLIDITPFDVKDLRWVEIDNFHDLSEADIKFSELKMENKKAIICDVDGTILLGEEPIPEAINFLKTNSKKYDIFFLTNNTSKTTFLYADKLKQFGLNISHSQIISPLSILVDYIKNQKLNSIYLVANKIIREYIKDKLPNIEIDFNFEKNQAVILTYDNEINFLKLKNIAILLNNKNNIKFIATHKDVVCPTEKGPIPDIGSFINLINLSTNRKPDIILGKPNPELISKQVKQYGKDSILIVGDRIYTDKKLADNTNCDFACVLSGETTRHDIEKELDNQPSIIIKDLSYLDILDTVN